MKKINYYLSKLFLYEPFIMAIVILNCAVLFAQCYYSSADEQFVLLAGLDDFFTILFIFEAYVKIKALKFKEYWKDAWNRMDFIITMITAVSLIQYISPNEFAAGIKVVSVVRTFRILKLIRLMRFVPNISSVVQNLRLAMRTTSVIMLAFFMLVLIISVVTCTIFKNCSPEYFGNPLDSLYNTFRIFTVEGWYEIPDSIVGNCNSVLISNLVRLYFSVVLFFGGIIGMGLITSMLVDAMAVDNNDKVLDKIKDLEDKIDELNKKLDERS